MKLNRLPVAVLLIEDHRKAHKRASEMHSQVMCRLESR